jgi:hypothetical protein
MPPGRNRGNAPGLHNLKWNAYGPEKMGATMREVIKNLILSACPPIKRLRDHRDALLSGHSAGSYLATNAAVLQYRRAHFEAHGKVAPGEALPQSHAWPAPDVGKSYKDKLIGHLNLAGRGVEIGPLNIPLLTKADGEVYFVDHLDTAGLKEKYQTLSDIAPIDLPMVNDSLEETIRPIAPIDYLVGSQVMEHVPNPIRWLQEIAEVMNDGGLVSLSLPDRRMTFDFFREESRPSEIVSAFLRDETVPNVQSVYDNQSLATAVNMHWAIPGSLYPDEIVAARGAISPPVAAKNHLELTRIAQAGTYLDAHCWVFTPTSFLLIMAQLAADDFLPYRLHQFYPTNPASCDRGSSSFTLVLERVSEGVAPQEKRRSFLMPLGE